MAKSKYEPTPEEQAKLGLDPEAIQDDPQDVKSEETQENLEESKENSEESKENLKETQETPEETQETPEETQEETFPSWITDEQKEMLADYFERHPFQKHFWLTESNHLFYKECDLLSAFREPTSIKYVKILREWVK